ncbi:MAG TPA: murein biosynthesis integral membrane protein MurJ, partial [Actinomycetes bacterium]|nr:murein biosynthesis integral membrane protein MurJ [Actinomycetes bacterium]
RRRLGGLDGARVVRTYVRLLVAGSVAGGLAWAAARLAGAPLDDGAAGSAVALAAGGVVLLATYVLLARLLHVHELTDLAGSVRGRVRR